MFTISKQNVSVWLWLYLRLIKCQSGPSYTWCSQSENKSEPIQKTKPKQLKSVNYKRRSRSEWKIIQDEKYIPWNIVSVISSFEWSFLAIIPFGDNNFTAGCPLVRQTKWCIFCLMGFADKILARIILVHITLTEYCGIYNNNNILTQWLLIIHIKELIQSQSFHNASK